VKLFNYFKFSHSHSSFSMLI